VYAQHLPLPALVWRAHKHKQTCYSMCCVTSWSNPFALVWLNSLPACLLTQDVDTTAICLRRP
jgi:hypothetical protein